MLLLLQSNLLHHLADFEFNLAIFWMIRRPWNNAKITGTNTVCHRVVDIFAMMRCKIIPDENSMEVSARYIVHLNIPADVFAKITKNIGLGSNSAYAPNTTLWVLDALLNMWSQGWIPRLDCKDDGNLCPVAVVSILTNT